MQAFTYSGPEKRIAVMLINRSIYHFQLFVIVLHCLCADGIGFPYLTLLLLDWSFFTVPRLYLQCSNCCMKYMCLGSVHLPVKLYSIG